MSKIVKDKLKQYLKYKGISESKFCQRIGLPAGSLDNKEPVSVDKLRIIARAYSDLNIEWLITGEGGMLKIKPEIAEDPTLLFIMEEKSSHLEQIIRENEKLIEELKSIKKDLPNTIAASIAKMRAKEA